MNSNKRLNRKEKKEILSYINLSEFISDNLDIDIEILEDNIFYLRNNLYEIKVNKINNKWSFKDSISNIEGDIFLFCNKYMDYSFNSQNMILRDFIDGNAQTLGSYLDYKKDVCIYCHQKSRQFCENLYSNLCVIA